MDASVRLEEKREKREEEAEGLKPEGPSEKDD
jgi:hypothetical protein